MPIRISQTLRCLFFTGLSAGLIAVLGGCVQLATPQPSLWQGEQERACLGKFAIHDNLIAAARRKDAQNVRVVSHPFLRVNRLLAALKATLDSADKRRTWIARLAALDQRSRRLENSNLPHDEWADLSELDECRTLLTRRTLEDEKNFAALLNAATVPDSYSFSKRLAGLYPLTRWPVYFGAINLHNKDNPQPAFITQNETQYYSSTSLKTSNSNPVSEIQPAQLSALQYDALGFPLLSSNVLTQLFDAYAPTWAIETDTSADQLGALMWSDGRVIVDGSATSYRHVSYIPFAGNVLVQLSYTVWFPAVPAKSALDIYAGDIDGLTFRVTLDHQLQPLLADIMHNCGCYYMAFPSAQLRPRAASAPYEEPLWTPYTLNAPKKHERYVVYLGAGNHFVQSVSTTQSLQQRAQILEVLPYHSLRSLPYSKGGARSAFSPRGLIENSHRLERHILWPMGIVSAGAMRQSGHHGIAFVGRRHFDDPDLISRYFEPTNIKELPQEE